MKLSSRFLAPLAAIGLAAAAQAGGPGLIRFDPPAPSDQVAPDSECTPESTQTFSRIATRATSESTAKGTLRGTMSTGTAMAPDILFSDFAGGATVELVLSGDIGGGPFVAFSPALDIEQVRGKWVFRGGDVEPGFQIGLDTLVVRPHKSGATASLTLKWEAALASDTWASFTPGTLQVVMLLTLKDGSNACVAGHNLLWDEGIFIDP